MSTKYQIIDTILLLLPKLTKQQLSEILLLCNAWSSGIALENIKRMPTEVQKVDSELKAAIALNEALEEENRQLRQKLLETQEYSQNLSGSFRCAIAENRKLKNQLFMSTGVRCAPNQKSEVKSEVEIR